MAGHQLDQSVLRKYDIRGTFGHNLHIEDACAVGRTFGSIVASRGGKLICIGRDGRLSSPELAKNLIDGLIMTGASIADIGLVTTPMLYFASKMLNAAGAVMVTGSHNPPKYNGFKMVLENAPFWSDQILELGRRAAIGDWHTGEGDHFSIDVLNAYVNRLVQDYHSNRELKVVWDAGNSSVGPVVVALTERLPGSHIVLNEKVDGTFPAHHPDPTIPENLTDLIKTVTSMDFDLGIAFDGDGDRIGAVDNEGRIIWGDQLLSIYASELLNRCPGSKIIADVKASQIFFDEVTRLGGRPIISASGHSVIKSLMAESGALLAGEMSGHIFFSDGYYGYDDALYASIRLLNILANTDRTLAEIVSSLPQMVNTPEIRVEVPEDQKFLIIDKVLSRARMDKLKIIGVDGLRVSGPLGWWLLRASNTENALVIRCESHDEAGLIALKKTVSNYLLAAGVQFSKL